MTTNEPPRESDPIPRFIGWLLMAVGVLWMAAAGICTIAIVRDVTGTTDFQLEAVFALIGVVAVAAGYGVFRLGRWLARN